MPASIVDRATTTVTIHDEPTRHVLLWVLWHGVAEDLYQIDLAFIDLGDAEVFGPLAPLAGKEHKGLDARLARLSDAQRVGEALKTATLGASLDVSLPAERLRRSFEDLRLQLQEDPDFWRLCEDARAEVLTCFDAARRLADELAPRAEEVTA